MTNYISNWLSIRQATGAALFISYVIYFVVWFFARLKRQRKVIANVQELGSKMYLVGIAGLLSMNFLQAGIFQAIMAYIVMLIVIVIFVASVLVDRIDDRSRCILFIVFYSFNFIWYLGIVIDYFVTANKANNY